MFDLFNHLRKHPQIRDKCSLPLPLPQGERGGGHFMVVTEKKMLTPSKYDLTKEC